MTPLDPDIQRSFSFVLHTPNLLIRKGGVVLIIIFLSLLIVCNLIRYNERYQVTMKLSLISPERYVAKCGAGEIESRFLKINTYISLGSGIDVPSEEGILLGRIDSSRNDKNNQWIYLSFNKHQNIPKLTPTDCNGNVLVKFTDSNRKLSSVIYQKLLKKILF